MAMGSAVAELPQTPDTHSKQPGVPGKLSRRSLCPACRPGAPTEVPRGARAPGDQPFWGQAVASAGVGPTPISIDRVTTKKLAAALRFMARPEARARPLLRRGAVTRGPATRARAPSLIVGIHTWRVARQPARQLVTELQQSSDAARAGRKSTCADCARRGRPTPQVKEAAVAMGQRMKDEDGAASAVDAFHRRAAPTWRACFGTPLLLHRCPSAARLACASGPAPHWQPQPVGARWFTVCRSVRGEKRLDERHAAWVPDSWDCARGRWLHAGLFWAVKIVHHHGNSACMRVAPCRHLPPEFVAAQRLREASNFMLQVPPPTPKQHMARSRTLGDDGGNLPAAGSLPADAAAAGCGGGGWTAAGSLWSLLRRGGNAGRGGAGGGGAGGAAATGAAGGREADGATDAASACTDAGERAAQSAGAAPSAEEMRKQGGVLHMSGGPGAAGGAAGAGAAAGRGARSAAGATLVGENGAGGTAGWAGKAARDARGGASAGESAFAKASGGLTGAWDGAGAQADSGAPRRVSFSA